MSLKPIPIREGMNLSDKYGYDQIVIIGRKTGENGGEHVTTYGVDVINCKIAAQIGEFLKTRIMGWGKP